VLVQGDVMSVEELVEDPPWSYHMLKESIERQPNMRKFVANPLATVYVPVPAHRHLRAPPSHTAVGTSRLQPGSNRSGGEVCGIKNW
jgi:hypothetical protein